MTTGALEQVISSAVRATVHDITERKFDHAERFIEIAMNMALELRRLEEARP